MKVQFKNFGLKMAVALSLVGFASSQAYAFPVTSKRVSMAAHSISFLKDGFNFDGVIALSNCSGSLVKFKGASDQSLAIVMTNGHCVGGGIFGGGMLKPGEVYYNKAQSFTLGLLDQSARKLATLRADKIIYATMTNTDVAFLQLTQTYADVRAKTGVDALEIADIHPIAGVDIEIPSGYWKKTYQCSLDGFVNTLKESDWTFKDSIRYSGSGCEVIGGTSGSPILSTATRQIVGINNTGNEDGDRCTLNNPCEVDQNGKVTVLKGRGYGQQVYQVYTCLNAQKMIDLSVAGCVLPKP